MEFWTRLISDFGPLCRQALELGIALLAQSALLLTVGLAACRLIRPLSPASQRALYRAALGSVGAAALITLLLIGRVPPLGNFSLPSLDSPAPPAEVQSVLPAVPPAAPEPPLAPVPPTPPSAVMPPSPAPVVMATAPVFSPVSIAPAIYAGLVAIWLAGSGGLLLWTLLCYMSVEQIRRRSVAATDPMLLAELSEMSLKAGLRAPALLVSAEIVSPFVYGLRRPVLILPSRLGAQANISTLRAVFAHEIAHIRSRDAAWMLAARLACGLFWVQPLLWALARGLEQASEEACDAAALRENGTSQAYARCLLDLAEQYRDGCPERVMGTGMALSRSSLARRITRILSGPHHSERDFPPIQSFALLALYTGLSAGAGWVVAAQFARQPTPPAVFAAAPVEGDLVDLTPPESPATPVEVQTATVEQDTAEEDAKRAEAEARRAQAEADAEMRAARSKQERDAAQQKVYLRRLSAADLLLAQQRKEQQRLYAADLLLAQEAGINAERADIDRQITRLQTELRELQLKFSDGHPRVKEKQQIEQELKARRQEIQARLLELQQKARRIKGLQRSDTARAGDLIGQEKLEAETRRRLLEEAQSDLQKRSADAEQALQELRLRYADGHPKVKKAQEEAENLEQELQAKRDVLQSSRLTLEEQERKTRASRHLEDAARSSVARTFKVTFGEDADSIELTGAPAKADSAPTCVMEFMDKDGNLLRKTIYVLHNATARPSNQVNTRIYTFNGVAEVRRSAPEEAVSARYHYESDETPARKYASDSRSIPLSARTRP